MRCRELPQRHQPVDVTTIRLGNQARPRLLPGRSQAARATLAAISRTGIPTHGEHSILDEGIIRALAEAADLLEIEP